jgi:hypothetical protein
MDVVRRMSPGAMVIAGGALLYVIFSFLDWQQVCAGAGNVEVCGGVSEWRGVGVVAALLAIAVLVWEAARAYGIRIQLGSLQPAVGSVGLAVLLLVFTVITFVTHNEVRHWPSWIGLILSVAIVGAAFGRAREEGVQLPRTAS